MPQTTAQKLKIKEGAVLLGLDVPSDFRRKLGVLPAGVKIVSAGNGYNQVHWFVTNKAQLDKELEKVLKLVKKDVVLWIYYPKGTSGMQTDLTRDKGWDKLLSHDEYTWISLVSFDETWSTFGSRLKSIADKQKDSNAKERPIFDYVDPKTKSIRLPQDLADAFTNNKKQEEYFNSLSFTNKKEYVEWIITAKREETRRERVAGTIERLMRKWKNPRNM